MTAAIGLQLSAGSSEYIYRKQYRSQNVAGTFKIDGEVREAEQDRRGQLRGGVQVPGAGHRPPRRHQEVRGERGRSPHQEDRAQGDPDAEEPEAPEPGEPDRGVPEEAEAAPR